MKNENFNKIYLMAFTEPEYARVDYWTALQEESKYSKEVFLRKLIDSHDDLISKIDSQEAKVKAYNPDVDIAFNINALYETDHELAKQVSRSELNDLAKSLRKLAQNFGVVSSNKSKRKKYPFERRKNFWDSVSQNMVSALPNLIKNGIIDDWIERDCKKEMPIKWHKEHIGLEPQLCYERLVSLKENLEQYLQMPELHEVSDIIIKGIKDVEAEVQYLKENGFNINFDQRIFDVDRTYPVLNSKNTKEASEQSQPIHWLKGEESLRLFLQSIIKEGLIENRETEDIIQEHFYVDGKRPIKEPQSIKWLIESKYLAYLMHRLAEEFIINIKGKKHELTASHFVSSEESPLNPNSLSSQLSQIKNESSSKEFIKIIESILNKIKS